ncbi:hypothetical protein EDB85DRAFT_2212827 [Lactarius pseudohatsudake]|nr:hypothetical protein EDB85DRAFT_2212827 [Lactarius pseudohatsudake]
MFPTQGATSTKFRAAPKLCVASPDLSTLTRGFHPSTPTRPRFPQTYIRKLALRGDLRDALRRLTPPNLLILDVFPSDHRCLHRQISYGKLPGLLELSQLTTTHLQWTQDGKKAPAPLELQFYTLALVFSLKEGGAQVRYKIGLENDSNGHNLAFTSPPPLALTEREMFKAQRSAHDYNQQQMCCTQHWRGTASRKQALKRPLLLPTVLFLPPLLLGLQTLQQYPMR